MIGIWYPAQKTSASRMPYRQYLEISPGPGPLAPFANRLEAAMRDVVGNETTGHKPGAMTPAETKAFEQLLAAQTLAVKNAPATSEKFPVILYHPGTAGTYEDNSALFEYLSSHGYIVVSSAESKMVFGIVALLDDDDTVGVFRSYWKAQIERGLKELGVQ